MPTVSSFRSQFDFDQPYWTINREERNYAALLYYALLSNANLERFLGFVDNGLEIRPDELAAYVEYAYLRDLWNQKAFSDDQKRSAVTRLLDTEDVRQLSGASTPHWNEHFGATPNVSEKYIQSPGRWSLAKYDQNIRSDDDFLATCKFKWSFNIKPDLVIQTDKGHAVVIEAKYESGESSYPASESGKEIFKRRGLPLVGQTELQRYMFRHLLGIEAVHLFVVKNAHAKQPSDPNSTTLTWGQVFGALDLSGAPPFVRAWLGELAD